MQLYPLPIHLLLNQKRLMPHHLHDPTQIRRSEPLAQLRKEGLVQCNFCVLVSEGLASVRRDEEGGGTFWSSRKCGSYSAQQTRLRSEETLNSSMA
jgi:hypothetical protein